VDLSSPEKKSQQQIPLASGLSGGTHSLAIKAAGPFALDGVIVDSPHTNWQQWVLPAIAGVVVAILVFTLAMARSRLANRGRLRI
jgi:hypothetical protein